MAREPEAVTALRQALGAELAAARLAADLHQRDIAHQFHYSRTFISHLEAGRQAASRDFWTQVDSLLGTEGALLRHYDELEALRQQYQADRKAQELAEYRARAQTLRTEATTPDPTRSVSPLTPPRGFTSSLDVNGDYEHGRPVDTDYVHSLRDSIRHLVALDRTYGGHEVSRLAVRAFQSAHRKLSAGVFTPSVERDFEAVTGEVAGWLCFDAERQAERSGRTRGCRGSDQCADESRHSFLAKVSRTPLVPRA